MLIRMDHWPWMKFKAEKTPDAVHCRAYSPATISAGGFSHPNKLGRVLFAWINRRTEAEFPINQRISPTPQQLAINSGFLYIQRLQSRAELVRSRQNFQEYVNNRHLQMLPSSVAQHQGITNNFWNHPMSDHRIGSKDGVIPSSSSDE